MSAVVVARWISVIGGSVLLILGTIGGVFNIAIFTHRSLNKCAYASYMLAAAFFDLAILDHPLVLRILADGFGIDPISRSNIYCKIRFFTGQISSFVPITLICLAAIDRWAVRPQTSPKVLVAPDMLLALSSRQPVDPLVYVDGVRFVRRVLPLPSPSCSGLLPQYPR